MININENVIQMHNDKDVKLLSKYLVDVSLEAYWCVCQTKRHHLVLKVTVSSLERGLPLVSFADSYLMVCTSKVELGKLLSPSQLIQQLPNQWQRIPVLDNKVIEALIVDT